MKYMKYNLSLDKIDDWWIKYTKSSNEWSNFMIYS